jgi:hypothetical protein
MRRAVLMTRQAISPRFAIRIFVNMASALGNPVGFALLEEGGHAFAAFVAGAQARDALRGVLDHFVARAASRPRRRSAACTRPAHAGPFFSRASMISPSASSSAVFVGHHFVQQADAVGLGGGEALRGQHVAPRVALADGGNHVGLITAGMMPSLTSVSENWRRRWRWRCRSRRPGRRRRRRPGPGRGRWSASGTAPGAAACRPGRANRAGSSSP